MIPERSVEESPKLTWSGMTHVGKVRTNNEDAFLALEIDATEVRYLGKIGEGTLAAADYVFAVSDGMGGARSGEFASRIAVEEITRLLPDSFHRAAQGISVGFEDILTEVFQRIHHKIIQLGFSYEDCQGMGATLSLAWLTPEQMCFGHIGDSRIYHLPRDGGIRQLSDDHSYVGWLRRTGQINEREARSHPRRNVLNRALGAGHQFVEPQLGVVKYERGDRFLLCSDGLTDGLTDARICELIHGSQIVDAKPIMNVSLENSGKDNTTALLVMVE